MIRRAAPAAAFLAALALAAGCGSGPRTGPESGTGSGASTAGGVTCSYPDSGDPARPVDRPSSLDVPDVGTLPVTLRTTSGEIRLTLFRAQAPCTVHSFVSLVSQSYFVDTPCHRLTAAPMPVSLLQCGDPTGTGSGGPGYVVQDELPAGLTPAGPSSGSDSAPESAAATGSEAASGTDTGTGTGTGTVASDEVVYPRGTVALSNRGVPDSGGSQFFLVYADSPLPPAYTVFGQVDAASLPVLDSIAAAGTDDSTAPGDGHPAEPVMIKAVRLPH